MEEGNNLSGLGILLYEIPAIEIGVLIGIVAGDDGAQDQERQGAGVASEPRQS